MKKYALTTMALILAVLFITGCNKIPKEETTVPPPPSPPIEGLEGIDLEDYLKREPQKVSKDPKLLEALWVEYIHPGVLNIVNGGIKYKGVSEIDPLNIARYLNYQMQREGVLEEAEFYKDAYLSYGVPLRKLEEYSERYFNVRINFKDYPNKSEMYVDEASGICYFYPNGTYDDLAMVAYNDINSWPNFMLDNVAIYEDGIYIATCYLQTYQGIEGELYEYKLVFKQREDESFYFVMADGKYPKTNKISVTGRYSPLGETLMEELPNTQYILEDLGQIVVLDQQGPTYREYHTRDLATGKTLNVFRVENSIQKPIRFAQMVGEKLVVIADRKIYINDCRSKEESVIELPNKLMDSIKPVNEYEEYSSITVSDTLDKLALVDQEGIKIFDLKTDKLTLIPDTAPKHDEEKIVENEGYGLLQFVDGGSKLWATKLGYEWRIGYMLYSLEEETSHFYPYGGGYDARDLYFGDSTLLIGHTKEGEPLENKAVLIDFVSGEALIQEMTAGEILRGDIRTNGKHTVLLTDKPIGQGMVSYKLYSLDILDNKQVDLKEYDLQISAPSVSGIVSYITESGQIYLKTSYLDEHIGIIVR